jgi:hypothetical protein
MTWVELCVGVVGISASFVVGLMAVVTAIRQNRTEGREETRLNENLRDDEE